MSRTSVDSSPLIDELKAMISGLEHARLSLNQGDIGKQDELWHRLDQCTLKIRTLDGVERDRLKPVMLALMDELGRTIETFTRERSALGEQLKSTSRNVAAGAAYRQAKVR